jgi:hypothetical protein
MKSIQAELFRIKEFLEEKIKTENLRMAKPPEEGDEESPLKAVRPKVAVGNIPHTNFPLYGGLDDRFYQAPYLLVGYEKAGYHPDDEDIDILIQACAYTARAYENEDEESVDFPDNMGVLDVTEMLERVMEWVRDVPTFPVGMEFEIGNYSTVAYTYPYNFAYLSFQLKTNVGALPRPKLF